MRNGQNSQKISKKAKKADFEKKTRHNNYKIIFCKLYTLTCIGEVSQMWTTYNLSLTSCSIQPLRYSNSLD